MSKITLNIVEPGSSTPVDPGINPAVPNTGLFTHGIGGPEATIITVSIVAVLAVVAAVLHYRKKHNKKSKLTDAINVVKSKKQLSIPLAALAMVVSLGTLAGLLVNAGKSNTNAAEGDTENSLTVTESSEDLTIEVADTPVFAVLPVELTVEEATTAGYTLTAFAEDTNLVSTTDNTNIIPMVAADEGELVALKDNTYGLSLVQPEDKDDEVYTTLSTDQDNPTILKTIDDYSETPAEDKTTIYYGFYITPDVPKGIYEGSSIYYEAEPNYITTLTFNGNGSDGGEAMEGITIPAGNTITLPANTYTKDGYHFTNWNTAADGTGEAYADEAEFTATQGETQDITLYAQWEEDILYMQDVATWGSNLQIGDEVTAVDSRDGKSYWVARLADDNIWMTQNLDFNIVNGGADLDSTNTDVPANWADAGNLANTYTTGTTTWNRSATDPESYDPGNLYWDGTLNTNWDGNLDNETVTDPSQTSGGTHYHIGNYYNWTAAVAMSNSSTYTSGDVNQSICPAGWRLPNLSEDKSYQNLVNAESLSAGTSGNIQNSPVYFVYGGYWSGRSASVGSLGRFPSSVVQDAHYQYDLFFNSMGALGPQDTGSMRWDGKTLRCVAR